MKGTCQILKSLSVVRIYKLNLPLRKMNKMIQN